MCLPDTGVDRPGGSDSERMDEDMPDETDEISYRWFGRSWGAPMCVPALNIPVPMGFSCDACDRAFVESDQGLSMPLIRLGSDDQPMVDTARYCYRCWSTMMGLSMALRERDL